MTEFRLQRQNQHLEHNLQEVIVEYLRRRWCVPIDTDVMDGIKYAPNDLARIKYINIHKARGYVKGQPDLIVLLPRGQVLLVELKAKSGRQSVEQKAFQADVENMGHIYQIWRSLDDAIEFFSKDNNVQTTGSGAGPLTLSSPLSKDKR